MYPITSQVGRKKERVTTRVRETETQRMRMKVLNWSLDPEKKNHMEEDR